MSCSNPLYALRLGAINPSTGKERIKVLPRRNGDDYFSLCERHGKDNVIPLPCGKCSGCIEARSKSWAIRCVCEASMYAENSFLTLTYNDKCLPNGLCKPDLQNFIRRLRKAYPDKDIRYFGCGEYGSHTRRPHYHLIVFGFFPEDAKVECETRNGDYFYSSKKLQKLWPFGFISVGECSYASCAYVARYCQKKLKNPDSKEFTIMSLKPGIGARYFDLHKDFIYKYDAIFGNFGHYLKHRPSRYFDKLFERCDPSCFQHLKEDRISTANSQVISDMLDHGFRFYEDQLRYQAEIKDKKFSRLKRKDL